MRCYFRNAMWLILAILLAASGVACSGDDEPGDLTENDGQQDAGVDADDTDAVDEDDTDQVCEPSTECPEDACGTIDDGCGGTIECGLCPCQEGAVIEPTCGSCELGSRVCGDDETGAGTCEERDIPGLAADGCDDLVFVDAQNGTSTGEGTKDSPLDTLEAGLSQARDHEALAVILAGQTSVQYEGPVRLDSAISIIGGYSSEWEPGESYRPTIVSGESVEGLEAEDHVGISSQGVTSPHRIEAVVVRTDDVVARGASNYGIHVVDSRDMEIVDVEVHAGNGGDGRDGDAGEAGLDGEDGGDAPTTKLHELDSETTGEAGANGECSEADGGAGGKHGYVSGDESREATEGESTLFAAGGSADGADGEQGTDGADGSDGDGGTATAEIVDGRWVSLGDGGNGGQGEPGSGGGGGGGDGPDTDADSNSYGGAGGGGGAGGCGGAGGAGGQSGGASFGLFISEAGVMIEDSYFSADRGGHGGNGANGGDGGSGGQLGQGATEYFFIGQGTFNLAHPGGDGGSGGDGGRGGYGGGGAGGPSYGAYCDGANVELLGDVELNVNGASEGGSSGAASGGDGEAGVSLDDYQCR